MNDTWLVAETEMPLSTINFPRCLDHGWGFATSLVHARPFILDVDGEARDSAATMTRIDEARFRITVADGVSWSDGRALTTAELQRAVQRGLRVLPGSEVRATALNLNSVDVESTQSESELRYELSSAAFSITPCVRDHAGMHTSGPYSLTTVRDGNRRFDFVLRTGDRQSPHPSKVSLISTHDVAEGRLLFNAGKLDLTRVLGGYQPSGRSKVLNRPVDFLMGIRLSPSGPFGVSVLAKLADILDRVRLADATYHTFEAFGDRITADTNALPHLNLHYADYFPNGQVVRSIALQVQAVGGVFGEIRPISYSEYTAGATLINALVLEIVHRAYERGIRLRTFLPLLRAISTVEASSRVSPDSLFVNSHAEIVWDRVVLEEI